MRRLLLDTRRILRRKIHVLRRDLQTLRRIGLALDGETARQTIVAATNLHRCRSRGTCERYADDRTPTIAVRQHHDAIALEGDERSRSPIALYLENDHAPRHRERYRQVGRARRGRRSDDERNNKE